MSLLLNKEKLEKIQKKEENGHSKSNNISKKITEEKEEDATNLTNIKVFNGLIEEKNIFKNLKENSQKSNINIKTNKNNKNDLDVYFNDIKMIDLNYISFGDCDNLFVNNLNTKKENGDKKYKKDSKNKDKKDKNASHSKSKSKKNKHSHSKNHYEKNNNNSKSNNNKSNNIKSIKIEKKYVEEILLNEQKNNFNKTMSFNDPKEINDIKITNNNNKIINEIIERKEKESKNYFKISSIKNGQALVVTGDDAIFTFPAYLLPKGAKLGESFTLEIKLYDNHHIIKKTNEEIENIQKKYI